jgi:hypothetical protein
MPWQHTPGVFDGIFVRPRPQAGSRLKASADRSTIG